MDIEYGCVIALVVFMVAIFVIAETVNGVVWLVIHGWPYIVLALVVGIVAVIVWLSVRRKIGAEEITRLTREVEQIKAVESRATQTTEQLVERRKRLEDGTTKLEELRQTIRGDINFQLLTQKHHESRLFADTWHTQKQQVIASRKEFSAQTNAFRRHIAALTRGRNGATKSSDRSSLAQTIGSAQSTLGHLSGAIATLDNEITRSSTALDAYNNQTRLLKEHIRDTCGPRGRRWYGELEARTRQRNIDKQNH